jgi:glycine cleavage system H protein
MARPEGLLFSKEHEWLKVHGDVGTVGITDYAQNALGDIVYVELPRVGQQIAQHGSVGVVESVKAVSDLFTPISGEVIEVNSALGADPALVNRDAFGEGWLYKVRIENPKEEDRLLGPADYDALIAEAH